MLVQGWKQNGYNVHTCDTADRWESAVHLKRNDCHPRGHGNEKVCLYPEGRSHTGCQHFKHSSLHSHLCRTTAVKTDPSSKIMCEQFHILQQSFALKGQTTSLLAPPRTNPFALPDRTAFSRISSLLLKLSDIMELSFCLVKLDFDKKPSYKVSLGKTLTAHSNLTCDPVDSQILILWIKAHSVLLLFNSFCFWLGRRNHKKTWNYNGAI